MSLPLCPNHPCLDHEPAADDHLVNLSSGAKSLQMFAQPPLSVDLQRLFSVGLCAPSPYKDTSSRAGPELTNDLAGGGGVFLRERDRLLYLSRFLDIAKCWMAHNSSLQMYPPHKIFLCCPPNCPDEQYCFKILLAMGFVFLVRTRMPNSYRNLEK